VIHHRNVSPLIAPAGSIVAMDGRVWHTSGANVTRDEDRALLFGYYSADFLRPQVNWNALLSQETQRDLDPWMRGRLGLDAIANVRVAAEVLGATPRSPTEAK
jgi:ectoine hydroxylase-related dioxygenase (phytanoyl-CoA dioxygenase family)